MFGKLIRQSALAAALILFAYPVVGQTAPSSAPAANHEKAAPAAAPSQQEVADAKAKGMVWVNTSTKVYHKDGAFYGATKHGKFMTEEDAAKAGYRAAKMPGGKKAAATTAPSK